MSQLHDEQIVADTQYAECTASHSEAWKDIIRPVTIFQLLGAETSPIFEDKSLVIDGRGFGAVMLVAHVIRVDSDRPAGITYHLEDGTGRMYAMKDLDSLRYDLGPEAEEEERAQSKAFEHTYVEVVGTPQKGGSKWGPRIKIISIQHVHDYHQVVHHILDVIHCNMLIQQKIPPYRSDVGPPASNGNQGDDLENNMLVDDCQVIPTPQPILPNMFSPQWQQPYVALEPLERAIVTQMHHHRDHGVSIKELAQKIQGSCGCTESQFGLALEALLAEAYLTSPLDDGYVVLTPRY